MENSPQVQKTQAPSAIRENIETVVNLEQEFLRARTSSDRIADGVAAFAGSMPFVLIHLFWFSIWILANGKLGLQGRAFDPYPYVLLSLIVSCEAVLLATFVLMKQNREARRGDIRDHLNLQIDLLAEKEITKILQMQMAVCERLGIRLGTSHQEIQELSEDTAVDGLAAELKEKIMDSSEQP